MTRRLLVPGALMFLAALVAAQVRLETRLTLFFLGQNDAGGLLLSRLQQSRFARRYLLAIEAEDAGAGETAVFARDLASRLRRLDGVTRVWSPAEPPAALAGWLQRYADHAEVIYSLEPEREAPRLFDPETLPRRASRLREMLLGPYGDWIQSIVRRDPLLLTLHAFRDWRDRLQPGKAGEFQALVIESAFDAFAIERQRALQRRLRQVLEAAGRPRDGKAAFRLTLTGVPVFAVRAQERIQADVDRVTLASTLGVPLVFLLLFRTLRSLPATAVVPAFAGAVGALTTQWVFGYVHGLTLALGATLIGVCVDYPIHVLAHCRAGRRTGEIVRRLWPALLLGGATTLVGYLALGATGYPGFQQVAVFAASGIVAALLATRFALPAFPLGTGLRPPRLRLFILWRAFCDRHRRPLVLLAFVAALASLASLPRLEWLDDLERLAAIDPELKRQDRLLRTRLGGIEPGRAVLIHAGDLESALQRAEAATRVLRRLRDEGRLTTFQSLYPWRVSRRLQRRNWRQYHSLVTPEFTAAWRRALDTAGLAVGPLAHLPAPAPVWLEHGGPTPEEILAGQMTIHGGGVDLAIWLGSHDPGVLRRALSGLPGVRYFSRHDHINALARRYRHRALQALGAGLVVIVLLLGVRYRSPVAALQVLAPAALGGLGLLACFAFAGLPVSFFHLLAALLAVAICVDYAIFYRECRGDDAAATYRAMGASMLTTVTAFAALGLAANPVLRALSLAVTTGVASGFFWCPILVSPKRQDEDDG